jgi:ABC-type sulfate/molybdate transport systems ATPase subunit
MVGTILSRILGLVREQITSWLFGTGDAVAAFTIADNIHTMLFDLVMSGMMQAALVPVLSQYAALEQRDELKRITGALLTLTLIVVGSLVVLRIRPYQEGADRQARLFFRPHDVDLVEDGAALAGVVTASRRVGGTRRVELAIGGEDSKVEIDLPFDHPAGERTRLAFRPRRWQLFAQ